MTRYALADTIIGGLGLSPAGTPPLLVGWHSYCGDFEHTMTTLVSKHGGRVHGLDTNPNLSFMSQLKLPEGYVFKNKGKRAARETTGTTTQVSGKGRNERAVTTTTATATTTTMAPARAAELKNKVLITLVQTDGLGLGAWAKGGRGTLPYSWEVTLPDLQIQVRGERTWMRRDE